MAVVSKRGQVIIPKKLRDKLRWHCGHDVDFEVRDGQVWMVKRADAPREKQGTTRE